MIPSAVAFKDSIIAMTEKFEIHELDIEDGLVAFGDEIQSSQVFTK